VEDGSFHAGHELNNAVVADVLNEAVDDGVAELAVGHLAATEAEAGLDLVAIDQEPDGLVLFGLVVVLVDGDGELDLFDDDNLLLFAGGALTLFLLVEVAAVVLDAADGRNGVGRDLDQIEPAFAGDAESFKRGQDAHLFAVLVDYADFACADPVVDADKRLCRTFVECDGAPPKVAGACPRGAPRLPQACWRSLSISPARMLGTKGLTMRFGASRASLSMRGWLAARLGVRPKPRSGARR
jgi:hypothetical protein